MKKIAKFAGYILLFPFFIWATIMIMIGWFDWLGADMWTRGLVAAIFMSICTAALSVFAGIKVVKKKSVWFTLVIFLLYFVVIIFYDRIGVFVSDMFIPIGPGYLPQDGFLGP